MPACIAETCGCAAAFFDRRSRGSIIQRFFDHRNRGTRPQEVDPFCMASVIEDTSLGYLTENCFTLRLELRIRSSDNEASRFVIRRRIPTPKRIVSCEVRVEKP